MKETSLYDFTKHKLELIHKSTVSQQTTFSKKDAMVLYEHLTELGEEIQKRVLALESLMGVNFSFSVTSNFEGRYYYFDNAYAYFEGNLNTRIPKKAAKLLDELAEIQKLFSSEEYQVEGFSDLKVTGKKVNVSCNVMLRNFIDVNAENVEKALS